MSSGKQILYSLKCSECGLEDTSLNVNVVDGHGWVVLLEDKKHPRVICFLCNARLTSKEA